MNLSFISGLGLMVSSMLFIASSVSFLCKGGSVYLEWQIFDFNSSSVVGAIILDWMSTLFSSFVCFISSMVLLYSGGYMRGDFNMDRFLFLVLCFVLSMIFLIISPSLISLLLGWDGLGLVSYLLVIYYQNESSASAGMLTVLSNRVGDVGILLSISLMMVHGSWNFICLEAGCPGLVYLLIMSAITKSAQIPFSAWLPAAMAAPTPVSALVHSSTLVTAGVYLMIRFLPVVGEEERMMLFILGCATTFMASLGAFLENDFKKIIALSTLSQLGLMMVILSLGWSELALFHLLSHALFKALLFMSAGSVIHSMGGCQDIRSMGGLVFLKPLTTGLMNISNLSLCGAPFLAGFYSKDLILEVMFLGPLSEFGVYMMIISTGLTVSYTFRLVYFSLTGSLNFFVLSGVEDEESDMTFPMCLLMMGAVCGGSILCWLVFPSLEMICLSLSFKLLVLVVSVLGGLVGYLINISDMSYELRILKSYSLAVFSGSMWFLHLMSTRSAVKGWLGLGRSYSSLLDEGWLERSGGQGMNFLISGCSGQLQSIQDNNIKSYLLMILMWLFVFFSIFW